MYQLKLKHYRSYDENTWDEKFKLQLPLDDKGFYLSLGDGGSWESLHRISH